jgi:ubiquinol-cytochrome c reductase cytochrome c1 subunit
LLARWQDPPAGVTLGKGQSYNPYFPGGKIGMEKQLKDGAVDYPDGTPATASQVTRPVFAIACCNFV